MFIEKLQKISKMYTSNFSNPDSLIMNKQFLFKSTECFSRSNVFIFIHVTSLIHLIVTQISIHKFLNLILNHVNFSFLSSYWVSWFYKSNHNWHSKEKKKVYIMINDFIILKNSTQIFLVVFFIFTNFKYFS